MLLRRQASTPSLHVCSLFSASSPHFPLQAPPWPQQLGLPFGLRPHLGHLVGVMADLVSGDVAVVVVVVIKSLVVDVFVIIDEVVTDLTMQAADPGYPRCRHGTDSFISVEDV